MERVCANNRELAEAGSNPGILFERNRKEFSCHHSIAPYFHPIFQDGVLRQRMMCPVIFRDLFLLSVKGRQPDFLLAD